MRRWRLLLILFTGFFISQSEPLSAQIRGGSTQGTSHTLYGEFKVEGHEAGSTAMPQNFMLVLRRLGGNVVGRQSVSNGGTYRFFEVANDDYSIFVLVDGQQMTQIQFRIDEIRSTDIRKNIALQWQDLATPAEAPEVYARSPKAAKQFSQAQKEGSKGNLKQATTLLKQLAEDDPDDYEVWTELGTIQFRNEKLKDAEKAYAGALKARPDYLLANLNLGKVRVAAKDYEGAIEPLSKAVELDPEAAEAHYLLGEAYLQIKKGSMAVEHFYEALRLEPKEWAVAHLRMAVLYNAAGMSDRAATELEQYLEKLPKDAPNRKEIEKFLAQVKKK